MAGRADRTAEDTVEYRLFPEIPDGLGEKETQKFLEETLDSYLVHLSRFLVDYIWQCEPLHLAVVAGTSGLGPPHLYGKTRYGDNVEDEWFIVYILCQLTQNFSGLVARVYDTDGEFLLIEAANHLPKWLNPDTSENRIFLYRGKLHIIPQPQTPAEITTLPAGIPQVGQALHCIREYPRLTLASDAIQQDVHRRKEGYPGKVAQFRHRAHCYLPAPLAAVLDKNPALVAPMVQAFYLRDPIDLKACVTMKHFRPGTRVVREVKFTKCLYAQMMQQRFTPDKRSGWNLLPTSNPKYKTHDLGMKLAHGAEILCANCGGETSNTNKNQSRNPALDTRWQHFKAALTQKGYFRGEIEGSRLYTKLADDARAFYYSSGNAETGDQDGPDAGRQILRVLRTVDYDIEEMRKEEVDLAPPDDDSWLDVSPEQLDDMLNRASDFPSPTAGGSNPFDMAGMADSMKAFVENISSHEGAEFPKTSEDSDIQFDPNSFIQTMQKMFEFEDSASDSSTDMSEYGSDDELGSDTSPPSSRPTERPKPPPRPKKESRSQEASPKKLPESTHEDYLGMQEYMKRMDQELATTTIGQSFETKAAAPEKKPRPSRPPPPRPTSGPPRRPTTAPPPPPRRTAPRATLDDDLDMDDDEDEDDFEPVDIDLNMVKNLLESYGAQDGLAGPTSNVLGAMGIPLPKNKDK